MTNHEITERRSPISIEIMCKCGWRATISRRQNALARAAKVRAIINKHLKNSDALAEVA